MSWKGSAGMNNQQKASDTRRSHFWNCLLRMLYLLLYTFTAKTTATAKPFNAYVPLCNLKL